MRVITDPDVGNGTMSELVVEFTEPVKWTSRKTVDYINSVYIVMDKNVAETPTAKRISIFIHPEECDSEENGAYPRVKVFRRDEPQKAFDWVLSHLAKA